MVAPLALGNRGWYARILATRPMVFLGEISYEIFLIHLIVMEIAMVDVKGKPRLLGRIRRGWRLSRCGARCKGVR